jgi:hypothetical protein
MKLNLNKWRATVALLLVVICGSPMVQATTLKDLEGQTKLTPEGLLRKFANFKFKLFDGVQPREQFLATQTGDCDDFATLAADLLGEHGYTTHLVAVTMEQQVHVVCYVAEANAYLDYNNRKLTAPLVPTNGRLADIAGKVARSFHSTWRCASEYIFKDGVQHMVKTDFKS